MLNVVSLDIETRDPKIKLRHGYLQPDFTILDCGASYFDKDGVLVSCYFDFKDRDKGLRDLLDFLDQHKFDKLVFHDQKYDLPALVHFGFPFRKYEYSDTMMYGTLLEPFRPSNSLANLCEEYDIAVKKISNLELISDIVKDVLTEVDLSFSSIEQVSYNNNKEMYISLLATFLSGKRPSFTFPFSLDTLEKNKVFIARYIKKTYGIDFKNIKKYLAEVKDHFPKIYYEYLTADTEATLLLYHRLYEEVDILCEDFDTTFTMKGKTLRDVVRTEEENMKSQLIMSTTPLALDWEKVFAFKNEYEENLKKITTKYPLFFHNSLANKLDEKPSSVEDSEYIDGILHNTRDLIITKYPSMFQRELNIIEYALSNLKSAKDKVVYASQSFLFQDINSCKIKNFKEITRHYLGDMIIPSKYITQDGTLSLSDYTITQVSKNEKITPELLLIFEFIGEVNKIDTNYTKFIKPFVKYKELKGDLYTQLYSYKTASNREKDEDEDEKGTVTGRLSSNHFNVQTLPKENKDIYGIRSLFLPRKLFFEEQKYQGELAYITIDWDGEETRLHNILSDCKKGLEMYRKNQKADYHLLVAASRLAYQHKLPIGSDYTTILLPADSSETSSVTEVEGKYVVKVSKVDRGKAKAVVFGVAYKIGPAKLADNLGISEEEAYSLLKDSSVDNPEYLEMYKQCIRTFAEKGYIANMFGRIYKPYKFKRLYNLSYFERFFRLEDALSLEEKGIIMEERKKKLYEKFLPSIWELSSKEFYQELMQNVAEYRDMTPLLPYDNYVKMYNDAKVGVYTEDTMSHIVYLMETNGLWHDDVDLNIKEIIAIHGKFIFKNSNFDYEKECKAILGKTIDGKYRYNSVVKKLRGKDLNEWKEQDYFKAVKAYMKDMWSWHICNHSIELTYDFLKNLVNFECQSTGADMLKTAIADMYRDGISDPESPNFKVDIHFPVHDDMHMTIKKTEDFEETIKLIKTYMEFEFKGVIMTTEETIRSTCQIS